MKFSYDPEADAASFELGENSSNFSHNEALILDGGQVILDVTSSGEISGIEFVGASALLGKKTIDSLLTTQRP